MVVVSPQDMETVVGPSFNAGTWEPELPKKAGLLPTLRRYYHHHVSGIQVAS